MVTQIGDAIIVVLFCLLVMYQPIKLIKDSFIEVSGGALNDAAMTDRIGSIVSAHIDDPDITDLFVSKTGSAYLVIAFMSAGFFGAKKPRELVRLKREVQHELETELGYVAFELTLAEDANPSDANASSRQR